MNPFPLLLLAAAAGGGSGAKNPYVSLPGFDTMLNQLHGAVNAMEKVNELRQMGENFSNQPQSLSSPPASAHVPVMSQPAEAMEPSPAPPSVPTPNIDLQGAMQALAPLLSMLGNNQNSR